MVDQEARQTRAIDEHDAFHGFAKSTAWDEYVDVVMNTPFFAFCPASAP